MDPQALEEANNFWKKQVEKLAAYSGTQREFCAEHGLSESQLSYHKTKIFQTGKFSKVRSAPTVKVKSVILDKPDYPQQRFPDAKWLAQFVLEILK